MEEIGVDLKAFVPYKTTSLETSYKWDLHSSGLDAGVAIDLIDPMAYMANKFLPPAAEDQEILAYTQGKKAMQGLQANDVSWLVKGTHTHNNLYYNVHRFKDKEGKSKEFSLADEEKQEVKETPHDLAFIKRSFSAASAAAAPQHPEGKSGVTADLVLPLFPDEGCWANTYQTVVVEDDVASYLDGDDDDTSPAAKRRRLCGGVVLNARSKEDQFGKGHFVGDVFVPTAAAAEAEVTQL